MSLILLVFALLAELVACLTGFGWLIQAAHPFGWLALGLVFYFASLLAGDAIALRRRAGP